MEIGPGAAEVQRKIARILAAFPKVSLVKIDDQRKSKGPAEPKTMWIKPALALNSL